MKKLIIIILISIIQILNYNYKSYSQSVNGFFDCGMPNTISLNPRTDPFRGLIKPCTTEWNGPNMSDSNAYFPVLVVFVQFADDPSYAPFGSWPLGQAPLYLDSMIATEKNMNSNTPWWEKYNISTEAISSQWMEISRGKFHVISPGIDGKGAFSVVLGNASNYQTEQEMNQAIWVELHRQGLIDWTAYDKWSFNFQDGRFYNTGDGYVDMIYKIHRARGRGPMQDNDGYSALTANGSGSCLVDTVNNITANYSFSEIGSGFTVSYRALKAQYLLTTFHEHGHFCLMGGHIQNSRVAYGIGLEGFFSPYDMILSGYMTPQVATFGANNSLGDYSSRNNNSQGEILKVLIDNYNDEYFLLANRRKVSKWDRVVLGDSAQINPYNDNSEIGKGMYIYHLKNGVHFPQSINDTVQDMECADGYWEWELKSTGGIAKVPYECFQSGEVWRVYQKKTVLYTNDPSTLGGLKPDGRSNYGNPNPWGDDLSFFYRYNNSGWCNRWTTGKFTNSQCGLNVDRLFTTDEDIIDNFNNGGDRYDAWNVGYNEVFSPYSSPNTFSWSNDTTGIFIYYDGLNGNTANIKIYRATEFGGETDLADILQYTPPSRPMGLKVAYTECVDEVKYPVLTWNHNMEPDMIQGEKEDQKRYKIYRAYNQIGTVPSDYLDVADILININDSPTWTDFGTYAFCETGTGPINSIRYKIQAVDNTDWASVFSDFVSASTAYIERGNSKGSLIKNNNEIKEYKLSQNYPNPFNPTTKINFAIPKSGFVTLKIYDILGREIKTLVNEIKQAGNYTVDFNASEFSSGVYFYRLEAGAFSETKRMLMIK